ncbi:DUF5316 domain-containing protein [Brevibacillus humidisoli]|uniref:DUF5316 domain-containing protein n=1 Tax=Brevibacillus humidisoli TaxID=2895522 RepID=UPI001E2F0704|nr:DUF5316 domain-containing protein [Brevibacillus humidisoli]UFJ41817.1 DUF5316 domain-containing protein [Brevibacillus humidisoli]
MSKSVLTGVALVLLAALAAFLAGDISQMVRYTGIAGFACWGLAAIFSGALVSGDRMRANFATETTQDRRDRFRWSIRFFLIGLPNVAAVLIILAMR